MVTSDKHFANVVGGKTARACDNCIRKRARWYCAADDAFLCQSCDGLVHAANPLSQRHERLRLKVALSCLDKHASPPWHQGFTKKPRTPRARNHHKHANHLVPEIGSDETTTTVTSCEEQLLYQVPVFDRFAAELCVSDEVEVVTQPVKQPGVITPVDKTKLTFDLNSLNGLMILPSDVELAEFAADVESLLGKGLDEESFDMEGLGFLDCREKLDCGRVKVEEDEMQYEIVEMMREPGFQLSFDYDSAALWEEDDDEKVAVEGSGCVGGGENKKKKGILKLDFEGIIAAWDEQRSPWTTGDRPEVDPDDCWPEYMGGCGITHHHHHHHHHYDHPHNSYGDMGVLTGNPTMLDRGREARVSRYREKRRTRLFSKKIRYEVRKLNAEKRPRMKGRFVKRTSSSCV